MAALGAGDIELAAATGNAQELLALFAFKILVVLALLPADLLLGQGDLELIVELQVGRILGAALFKLTGHHTENAPEDEDDGPCIKEGQGLEPRKDHKDQCRLGEEGRELVDAIASLHQCIDLALEIIQEIVHGNFGMPPDFLISEPILSL